MSSAYKPINDDLNVNLSIIPEKKKKKMTKENENRQGKEKGREAANM